MSRTRRFNRCGKREPAKQYPSSNVITAQEASTKLESAVSHCQSAGMTVEVANGD